MKTATWPMIEQLTGQDLVGREIWFRLYSRKKGSCIILDYNLKKNEHKVVFIHNGSIRNVKLHQRNREWILIPKRSSTPNNPVLEGTIIEFLWPKNSLAYHAMVYKHSRNGQKLKVVFCETNQKEVIQRIPWDVVDPSPCRAAE